MSTKQNIQVRDARDRLSELLGLGEPCPLRDLPVPAEGLTVPFGQAAKIPVNYSQLGVLYQLHDHRERPVTRPSDGEAVPVQADGTGAAIHLETPGIEDDVTYKILATKIGSGREAYLHATAIVKVGLDTTLTAWIRNQPPLDPTADPVLPTDPRLADYDDTLEVEIEFSQEGVDYRLVHFVAGETSEPEEVVMSVADVRGTSGTIVLHTKHVQEDTTVRIRATKTFEQSEGRETETDLLDIELPLKVKANRALNVMASPASIVDFGAEATVRIASSQRNAQYRVFVHKVRDPEFVHDPAPDSQVVRVQVAGEPQVQVRRPSLPEPWAPIADYVPASEFQVGNGGELAIGLGQVTADSLVVIEARKEHRLSADRNFPSSVWLVQPAAILTRPNPLPDLKLSVVMQGAAATDGRLRVEDGQPGVFYFFRTTVDGDEFQWPAYFYQRDEIENQLNKGVGQLEVEIDMVVATDPLEPVDPSTDRASLAPQSPVLETGTLAAGTTLHIRAVKAQTQIEVLLTHTAQVAAVPEIRPEQTSVEAGSVAKILILASHAGDQYALMLNGEAVRPALAGNGSDLDFATNPINADTVFEVWVTNLGDVGVPVVRTVSLRVLIRPDATLVVSAAATEVEHNGATEILIASSQVGVSYQLLVGGSATGDALPGNGAILRLPTGSLTADTTFGVRASRTIDPTVLVELGQTVAITVRPAGP